EIRAAVLRHRTGHAQQQIPSPLARRLEATRERSSPARRLGGRERIAVYQDPPDVDRVDQVLERTLAGQAAREPVDVPGRARTIAAVPVDDGQPMEGAQVHAPGRFMEGGTRQVEERTSLAVRREPPIRGR